MFSVSLPVLMLFLWGRVSLAGPQCERSSAVRVSVSSWRNQTGHRLLAAEMRSDISLKDAVSLSVDQWIERCGAAGIVALSLTATSAGSNNTAIEPVPTSPATPVLPTVTVRTTPRPDYHHLPGHGYYKKHDTTMSWEEGRRTCESEGAHLAVFETREEFDAVYDFSECCPWIGVYRQDTTSPWITVLGQPMSNAGYAGWMPGAPEDYENCVSFDRSSTRGINSQKCARIDLPTLCELVE